MSFEVSVIGEIYLDHVFSGFDLWPGPGEEIFTDEYTWELGGGAVTTACALARLGRSVQLIGIVGEAQFGAISERLDDFSVSAENLVRAAGRTGVTVSISTTADRSFFTYRGVNVELKETLLANEELLKQAAESRHIHLAFPLTVEDASTVVPALRQFGGTVSLDVGHHAGWLADPRNENVLRLIDYTMPNEKEASMLAGGAEAYLSKCVGLGVRYALVKLGAAGVVLAANGRVLRAAPPAVKVIDTTGAGDAFNAGFIDAVLAGLSPQEWIEHGCICGALSTQAAGALSALPTRAEAEAAAQENYAT